MAARWPTEDAVKAKLEYIKQHPDHPEIHVDTAEAYRNEADIGRTVKSDQSRRVSSGPRSPTTGGCPMTGTSKP